MIRNRVSPSLVRLALAATCGLAACSDSSTGPSTPPVTQSIVVDASQPTAYVALGDPATAVSVSDPTTSAAWDMSFFATTVGLNGGAAGPGEVTAYCICQNASATDAEIEAMTADNQAPAFDGVADSDVPGASSFSADALLPAISGWYVGSPGAGAAADPARAWIIRTGSSNVILAKFHVTGLSGATAADAGSVTFEYAIQPSPGAPFGPTQSATVDVHAGTVSFNLSSGAETTGQDWDLRFTDYDILVNGGVSGSGTVSAVVDNSTPYAQIDAAYAATAPPQAYRADAYSGVFAASPWYRYNITGTDNQIWPTFNVYLVRRGNEVFKVQLTSYYGTSGASRQITMKYARLR